MRRIVPIVLALLVLLPTVAQAAALYRCAHDGQVRKTCCCPTKATQEHERETAPAVRKSSCCTVTTIQAPPASMRDVAPTAPGVDALPAVVTVISIELTAPRPFRISDLPSIVPTGPPDRLFVRHSALLL